MTVSNKKYSVYSVCSPQNTKIDSRQHDVRRIDVLAPEWSPESPSSSRPRSASNRDYFRDLLRLNVARNSLSEIPSDALLQLKNLNQLDLSFNKITDIKENTFMGRLS